MIAVMIVLLGLWLVPVTSGAADIKLNGIGGRVGFVAPEDPIESTFGLGLQADLGTITEGIHFGALLEYWGKSYDAPAGLHETAEWSWSQILVAATFRYMFPTESNIGPYLGGEIGLAIGRWEWEHSALGDQSDSDTEIGFGAFGGVEIPLSDSMKGFAEAKYHIDGADYLGIFGGITFALGN
jgi:opacity protein-like surface antigen